jgi:hypothetical protein
VGFAMKYEPEFGYLKSWFFAERDSGYGVDECVRIADFVSSGKRYSNRERLYLLSRKASCLYLRARDDLFNTPEKAISELHIALKTHLHCYEKYRETGDYEADKSEGFARNTAYFFFDFLLRSSAFDDLFAILTNLLKPKEWPAGYFVPA